jgi:hypothetical protein
VRSFVYNGFVWELNFSTSGELNDDKSSDMSETIAVAWCAVCICLCYIRVLYIL